MNAPRPFAEFLTRALRHIGDKPPPRAGIAGAHDAPALECALEARRLGLVHPLLIGNRGRIEQQAREWRKDIDGILVEDIEDAEESAIARRTAELARDGEVDMVVKGGIHTDALMRALLDKQYGLRTARRASHAFLLEMPQGERILISDAALNIAPDEATLPDIARNALALAENLGMEARAALLSASEIAFPALESSMRAAAILETLRAEFPRADIAGPYALDIAISPEAAQRKRIRHPVAGRANTLIVPNIETGNALYKLMVWRLDACAAGVICGLRLPVALTSRSDPPAARLGSLALAVLQNSPAQE